MRVLVSIILGFALAACTVETPIRADKIFTGGTIYTGLGDGETVEAVGVRDGQIIYAGSMADVVSVSVDEAEIIDLDGSAMYPGFVDAHAHLLGIGQRELSLNLDDVTSIAMMQERIAAASEGLSEGSILYGRGWIETHYPEERFPAAADLDAAAPGIAVILIRADGHALVASTKALEMAGITDETEDPDGGRIERDETGAATGMLIDGAMPIVSRLITKPSDDDVRHALETGLDVYASRGWTGLHNMAVGETELDQLGAMAVEGDLPIRVYNAVNQGLINETYPPSTVGKTTTRAVKVFMDGALGSRGALLIDPYSDAPDTNGLALRGEEESLELMTSSLRNGTQLAIHAIGDLGNKRVLDWMEQAFDEVPVTERAVANPRWRIEHSQILRPIDIPRFAELGIIPSMQPSHAIGDLHFAPARLGAQRLEGAYAWRDLIDSGSIIAGGSDAPVEVGSPLIEFYAACIRKDLTGYSDENWHPEQAVSRAEALQMLTYWPAYASFQEKELGTIESGKRADFTVFSKDIMTVEPADILTATAVMTVVEGEVVYQE